MNPFTVIIEAGLMLLILFAPFAFGSVPLWANTVVELTVLGLLFVWVIKMIREGEFAFPGTGLNLPVALFLGLVIFQMIPIGTALLGIISPATNRFYIDSFMALGNAAEFSGLSSTITLNSYATKVEFWRMLSYLGAFYLVIANIRTPRQIHRMISVIIVVGFLLALFGLIQYLSWNGKVFWVYEYPKGGNPFGSFINKNNYAGFINMIIPLALAFSLYAKDKGIKFLFAFMALLMAITVFLSMSRGGVFSFFASMTFMGGMLIFVKRGLGNRSLLLIAVAFGATLILYLVLIGMDPVVDRLSTLTSSETYNRDLRLPVWASTLDIIKDYPLFGTGFGTFESVFPGYRPIDVSYLHWRDAHNDYLQLLSDTGIAGFLIVTSFFVIFFKRTLRVFTCGRFEDMNFFILSLMGSVVAFLFSIIFTFNTHIPASAFLFAVILALTLRLDMAKERN